MLKQTIMVPGTKDKKRTTRASHHRSNSYSLFHGSDSLLTVVFKPQYQTSPKSRKQGSDGRVHLPRRSFTMKWKLLFFFCTHSKLYILIVSICQLHPTCVYSWMDKKSQFVEDHLQIGTFGDSMFGYSPG